MEEIYFYELNNQASGFSIYMKISEAHESYINCLKLITDEILLSVSHDFKLKVWEIDED